MYRIEELGECIWVIRLGESRFVDSITTVMHDCFEQEKCTATVSMGRALIFHTETEAKEYCNDLNATLRALGVSDDT